MSVVIDGEKYKLYSLDTVTTFCTRFAVSLSTPVKYIIFDPPVTDRNLTEEKFTYVNLLEKLIKYNGENVKALFSEIENLLKGRKGIDFRVDIVFVYLTVNEKLNNLVKDLPDILTTVQDEMVDLKYFEGDTEFQDFWNSRRAGVEHSLASRIKYEKNSASNHLKMCEMFDDIKEGLIYTDIAIEKITTTFDIDSTEKTTIELFNLLLLNDRNPYAQSVTKDNETFYKVYKNYTPLEGWNVPVNGSDLTMIKSYTREEYFPDRTEYFNTVTINDKLRGEAQLVTEYGYLSVEKFLEQLKIAFDNRVLFKNVESSDVTAIFYFPRRFFNNYVFADLVAIDSIFSSLITIDESAKATKRRSSGSWAHIHFTHPKSGDVSASITQRIQDGTDQELRKMDMRLFPMNKPYIRVRCKGRSVEAIKAFQEILSKLMVMYEDRYDDIVKEYTPYIPEFGEFVVEEKEVKKKVTASYPADIFVSNYTRYCDNKKMPTIIPTEQVEEYIAKGKNVMSFPREAGEYPEKIPSDGINIKHYVCLNPDFPYPGLQINRLDNNDKYPYVPCCFKMPQDRPGSLYRYYFHGEQQEMKESKQQEMIVTDKILNLGKQGVLPENLLKFFGSLENDKYIRVGVSRSQNSLIHAVMYGSSSSFREKSEDDQNKEVKNLRKNLKGYSSLFKQSMYDSSTSEIVDYFESKKYMDPRLCMQGLEDVLKVQILTFDSSGFVKPRYIDGYYRWKNNLPVVLIYEHWGSETDRAQFPQCEVICKVKRGVESVFSTDKLNTFGFTVINTFYTSLLGFSLTKMVKPVEPLKEKIERIYIDTHGKVRVILFEYGNIRYTCRCSPLPPVNAPMIEEIFKVTLSVAVKIAEKNNGKILSQKVQNGKVIFLEYEEGGVTYEMYTLPTDELLGGVLVKQESLFSDSKESNLQKFSNSKKLARYLTEYTYWMFSRYVHDNDVKSVDDKVISEFFEKHVEVDQNHVYNSVSKLFGVDNSIVRRGKIIVNEEEVLKRLAYVLKLFSVRSRKTLLDYRNRESLRNFYVDVTDFEPHQNQIILQGEGSLTRYISDVKMSSETIRIYDGILPSKIVPYFFKNPRVDGKVRLARNLNSLEMAIDVAIEWKGGEKGEKGEKGEGNVAYTFYSYRRRDDIILYRVKGRENDYDIKVVGYTLNDTPFYTVLLDLD